MGPDYIYSRHANPAIKGVCVRGSETKKLAGVT